MTNASAPIGSSFDDASIAPHSLTKSATVWLAVLWLIWAGMLFGGFFVGELSADGTYRIGLVSRLGSSVVLVLAAASWVAVCRGTLAGRFAWLIAIGMTLGTLGDFFNADVLQSIVPLPNPVLGAIAAFGLGHIAYIAACLDARHKAHLTSRLSLWTSIGLWQLVGLVGWLIVVYPSQLEGARALVWPALPYSLLLAGTAGFATALAVQDRRFTLLAAGAALFLLSDLILAWRLFRGPFSHAGDAVWLTYGPGQMLIVFALATCYRVIAVPRGTQQLPAA